MSLPEASVANVFFVWRATRPSRRSSSKSFRKALIQLAKRRFQGYGEFVAEGEWALTAEGAKLSDPRAFALQV